MELMDTVLSIFQILKDIWTSSKCFFFKRCWIYKQNLQVISIMSVILDGYISSKLPKSNWGLGHLCKCCLRIRTRRDWIQESRQEICVKTPWNQILNVLILIQIPHQMMTLVGKVRKILQVQQTLHKSKSQNLFCTYFGAVVQRYWTNCNLF